MSTTPNPTKTETMRERIEEIVKMYQEDYKNYNEYAAMENNPTPEQEMANRLLALMEAERKKDIEIIVNKMTNKPTCTKEHPCGCHFGEVTHFDDKCACIVQEDMLATITKQP